MIKVKELLPATDKGRLEPVVPPLREWWCSSTDLKLEGVVCKCELIGGTEYPPVESSWNFSNIQIRIIKASKPCFPDLLAVCRPSTDVLLVAAACNFRPLLLGVCGLL